MLSEDEKAIQFYKRFIEAEEQELEWMYREDEEYYKDTIEQKELLIKGWRNILNLITKLQKEVEHQKEKRENQKVELAILNEKQKDMNKLINTVKSYKGQFKRQEKEIKQLQKGNEEKDKTIEKYIKIYKEYDCYRWVKELEKKDKQIDLMAERIEWLCKSNGVLLDVEHGENFFQEDIKQYFEKLAKEKGE